MAPSKNFNNKISEQNNKCLAHNSEKTRLVGRALKISYFGDGVYSVEDELQPEADCCEAFGDEDIGLRTLQTLR